MVKYLYLFLCILLLGHKTTLGQSNNKILRGVILYQNSGKKAASNVEVSGLIPETNESANLTYSNDTGEYDLVFPKSRVGYFIQLTINDTIIREGKIEQIEVVNNKALEICRLPAIVSEVFKIIVCPKGARDTVAQRYYGIIKTSADKALAKKIKALNELIKKRQINKDSIDNLTNEIVRLSQQTDSLIIYREAYRIASINLDDASDRVKKYIQLLDAGESIQEARMVLKPDSASMEMDRSLISIEMAIKEIETIAEATITLHDFQYAAMCYDIIIFHLSEDDFINPMLVAGYNLKAAAVMDKDNQPNKALEYELKALKIQEGNLPSNNHKDLIEPYYRIATRYNALNKEEDAIKYYLKSLNIITAKSIQNNPFEANNRQELASFYNKKGEKEYQQKQYNKAIEWYQKAVALNPEYKEQIYYNNIGLAYGHNEQFKEAYEAFEAYEKLFPNEGKTYRNWAMYYALQNKKKKALSNLEKAIELGYNDMKWLQTDDSLTKLRKKPQFIELVKKLEAQIKE